MEPDEQNEFRKRMRVLRLIWGAMLASLAVYIVVAGILPADARAKMGPDFPMDLFRNILIGWSLTELGAAYIIRRFVMRYLKKRSAEAGEFYAYQGYTVAMLIFLAISESVGIYGLVLFLIGDNMVTLGFFMFLSAGGMVMFRPRAEELAGMMPSS